MTRTEEIERALASLRFRSSVGFEGLEDWVYDLSNDVEALRTLVLALAEVSTDLLPEVGQR